MFSLDLLIGLSLFLIDGKYIYSCSDLLDLITKSFLLSSMCFTLEA